MNDRIEQHYGQQLSALMDGELAPDQARFLLRRLEHDRELAGSWERWHLAGEVLRGAAVAALPQDFSVRIGTALAGERAAVATGARRAPAWLRWSGGAALAASVAAVALLAGRPSTVSQPDNGAMVVDAGNAPAARSVEAAPAAVDPPDAPGAVAAIEADRAPAAARREAREVPRVSAAAPAATEPTVVASAPVDAEPASQDPFSGDIVTRPWPRAVLPQFGGGVLATGADSAPSFYPFDPRPVPSRAATLPTGQEAAATPDPTRAP